MAIKEKISVCAWCKHVVDAAGMPLPEQISERESFTEKTGVIISDTKCKVCRDHDTELKELRRQRAEKKKAGS